MTTSAQTAHSLNRSAQCPIFPPTTGRPTMICDAPKPGISPYRRVILAPLVRHFWHFCPKVFRLDPEQNSRPFSPFRLIEPVFFQQNTRSTHFHTKLTDFRRFGRADAGATAQT